MTKKKYTTIPVLVEVKERLNSLRGDLDWNEFLISLVEENIRLKRMLAARRIQERFNEKVERNVRESIASMRKMSLVQKDD